MTQCQIWLVKESSLLIHFSFILPISVGCRAPVQPIRDYLAPSSEIKALGLAQSHTDRPPSYETFAWKRAILSLAVMHWICHIWLCLPWLKFSSFCLIKRTHNITWYKCNCSCSWSKTFSSQMCFAVHLALALPAHLPGSFNHPVKLSLARM